MWHNPRKKALYEVIGKSRNRPVKDVSASKPKAEPPQHKKEKPASTGSWRRKPPILQYNNGRLEISLPYQAAIAIIMAVVLLGLVVFRLGQGHASEYADAADGGMAAETTAPEQPRARIPLDDNDQPVAVDESGEGQNRIVIQTYRGRDDLIPVQRYFSQHGIDTEIVQLGTWYYLVTAEGFAENPNRAGTRGWARLQKIKELGADYEAPPGYETFGARPFHDAYGKRFADD